MLHVKTYDRLSNTGRVIDWKLTPAGGVIVVQDSPSVFTIWHETWEENLLTLGTYDIFKDEMSVDKTAFLTPQEIGKDLLNSVVVR